MKPFHILKSWINSNPTAASCLVLWLAVLGVYAQIWSFDFVNWDDSGYVRDNWIVLQGLNLETFWWSLSALDMANWHPVTWWSYLLDISLFGPNPSAFHVENLAWHGVNSVSLYLLLLGATRNQLPSLLSAVVFAVHPLHVESVAWIAERKDLLSAFFLFATLWQYWKYIQYKRRKNFWAGVLFAALGTMAKPTLVSLPLLLLIVDYWPGDRLVFEGWRAREGVVRNFRKLTSRCLEKWPFFLVAGVSGALTLLAQTRGGSMRMLQDLTFSERLANAVTSYFEYLVATAFPVQLSFMYLYRHREVGELIVASTVLLCVSIYAFRKRGAFLAGWAWFLVSLIPVIGLMQVGDQARADRYMYLPMIGLTTMLFFFEGAKSFQDWKSSPLIARAAIIIALFAGAALAWSQVGTWRNTETMVTNALAVDPENYVAHTVLSQLSVAQGLRKPAIYHADSALAIAPTSPAAGAAANAVAALFLQRGEYDLAKQYLEKALRAKPVSALTFYSLGEIAIHRGDYAEASELYTQAVEVDPNFAAAYNNLGIAYRMEGKFGLAVDAFQRAVELNPRNELARENLRIDRMRFEEPLEEED